MGTLTLKKCAIEATPLIGVTNMNQYTEVLLVFFGYSISILLVAAFFKGRGEYYDESEE